LRTAVAFAAALVLAGCGAAANAGGPTWVPKRAFTGEGVPPNIPASPDPHLSPGATPSEPSQQPSAPKSSKTTGFDPFVVATNLKSPVGLAVLPAVFMLALLLRVSGAALLEHDIGERRPGYAEYVRQTSGFLPWPPRRLP